MFVLATYKCSKAHFLELNELNLFLKTRTSCLNIAVFTYVCLQLQGQPTAMIREVERPPGVSSVGRRIWDVVNGQLYCS